MFSLYGSVHVLENFCAWLSIFLCMSFSYVSYVLLWISGWMYIHFSKFYVTFVWFFDNTKKNVTFHSNYHVLRYFLPELLILCMFLKKFLQDSYGWMYVIFQVFSRLFFYFQQFCSFSCVIVWTFLCF